MNIKQEISEKFKVKSDIYNKSSHNQMGIDVKNFNYDDSFIRDVTLGVISELNKRVRWVNTWDDKQKLITVPVYYGLGNDMRYLIDNFIDDIIGKRPELNYDPIPRAHISIVSSSAKKDEICNPNVYLEYEKLEKDGTLKRLKAKMKILPIVISYNIEFKFNSEIDVWKATQSIWDWLYNYKYFYITYNSIRTNCVFMIPDDLQADIQRQIQFGTTNERKISFTIETHTEYQIPLQESKPVNIVRNRAIFYGNVRSLGKQNPRQFLGGAN